MASTPARRPESSSITGVGAAGLPGPQQTAAKVSQEPLEQSRDFGGLLILAGAVGSLVLGWTLFSNDEANGMWAGYWNTLFCTLALLAYTWLRGPLPAAPGVAIAALSGLGLILTGALHDYDTSITIIMVAGGVLIGVGAAASARG